MQRQILTGAMCHKKKTPDVTSKWCSTKCHRWYAEGMNRVLFMLALTTLVSCATVPQDEISAISRPFTSIDAGQRIILSKNRTFEIKLPSNPGSGYDWVLSIDNPEVISSGSNRFSPDRSGRKGLGGETMWSLRTRSPGDATLTYSYQHTTNTRLSATRTVTFMIGVR